MNHSPLETTALFQIGPVAITEPTQPITFKISGNVIGALRAYAAAHDLTLSEVVTRAITEFVARASRHG